MCLRMYLDRLVDEKRIVLPSYRQCQDELVCLCIRLSEYSISKPIGINCSKPCPSEDPGHQLFPDLSDALYCRTTRAQARRLSGDRFYQQPNKGFAVP